jgi:hypothetical protein
MAKLYAETVMPSIRLLGFLASTIRLAKIRGLDLPIEQLVQCAWAAHRASVMPEQPLSFRTRKIC